MPFHAEAAELERFVQEMNTQHNAIATMINKSSVHAHTLNGAAFQGGAGSAFQATFERFLTAANKMNETLLQNADNLKKVGEQYSQIEQQSLSQLSGVGSNVPDAAPGPGILRMT
ncbi:WXG100 family type VII secretion target [Nocardia sp. NPDC003482]